MTTSDILFFLGAISAFLFLPMVLSKFSQKYFRRNIESVNSVSENFKDDRINEEMVSAKILLEGVMRGGG